ncbi:hypothetical protein [Cupriavidus sp. L7L]|uniref:hypothetical protein n=1 Tax=Cupriavidus sp. L7L TaxID=2546443 RepID=UPI0010566176|nr:hypothetical protein [Cupriavidus sp. L7L]TDF55098.1 hypothetical protein E1J61_36615 [Cupriavidus sp. L7L]
MSSSVEAKASNPLHQLEPGQLEALSRFREESGSRWKSKLLAGWVRAAYPGHLQAIRNQLGPEWLATVTDEHFRHTDKVEANAGQVQDGGRAPRPRM